MPLSFCITWWDSPIALHVTAGVLEASDDGNVDVKAAIRHPSTTHEQMRDKQEKGDAKDEDDEEEESEEEEEAEEEEKEDQEEEEEEDAEEEEAEEEEEQKEKEEESSDESVESEQEAKKDICHVNELRCTHGFVETF